jgi:ABC-2 type transport system ATP-binding protein
MPVQISIANLVKHYGSTAAVDGLSFEVNRGEIFGLLGANGAGKTTTLECLAGLRKPDAGELRVAGEDPVRRPRAASERVGAVLQRTELPDQLTPREALALFGAFFRRRAGPGPLLDRFKLREKADAPYCTLSGGQRQRLALALAFVNEPEVVLLDEPATGLDPQAREELHAQLLALREDGQTVLLSTHDLEEAERLCDRVAVLHQGRLVALGAPGDLRPRGRDRIQVIRLRSRPAAHREQLANLAGVQSVGQEDGVWLLETGNVAATMIGLGALLSTLQAEIVDLQTAAPTLQQVYLEITGGVAGRPSP